MTKNRKKAAALRYNPDSNHMYPPTVTAVGKGIIAEDIIAKAKEHHVPILEDPTLVELLSELNINEVIPEELYEAVAEVFAFIYQLDKQIETNT